MFTPSQKFCAPVVLLVLAIALMLAPGAEAQAAYLVSDINTAAPDFIQSSHPTRFFNFEQRALFVVRNGAKEELWISDLTAGGTVPVSSR
ncbi:MAG TPA: hypothetical protein VMS12_01560 [Thermoanaerobaculia bacterium]|nr:hypothetical protein [Thermoanaerobaculia bacterium]